MAPVALPVDPNGVPGFADLMKSLDGEVTEEPDTESYPAAPTSSARATRNAGSLHVSQCTFPTHAFMQFTAYFC